MYDGICQLVWVKGDCIPVGLAKTPILSLTPLARVVSRNAPILNAKCSCWGSKTVLRWLLQPSGREPEYPSSCTLFTPRDSQLLPKSNSMM